MEITAVHHSVILRVLTVGRAACSGAVAGTALGTVGCRVGAASPPTSATSPSAFASPFSPLPTFPRRGGQQPPAPCRAVISWRLDDRHRGLWRSCGNELAGGDVGTHGSCVRLSATTIGMVAKKADARAVRPYVSPKCAAAAWWVYCIEAVIEPPWYVGSTWTAPVGNSVVAVTSWQWEM